MNPFGSVPDGGAATSYGFRVSSHVPNPEVPTGHTQGHLRALFRRRGFRRLLTVRITSQLADGFFQAGLAVSVFFNPNSQVEPIAYAVAFALLAAPYSILGPYVGVFLDRWSRRAILAVSNLIRAIVMIPIALVVGGDGPPWIFIALALVAITINRFVLAGLSASQPHVVEPRHLVTANSFASTSGSILYGLGLGGAYIVIQFVIGDTGGSAKYALAVGLAVPLYALSALVAWRSFGRNELGPDETERAGDRIRDALVAVSRGMVAGFVHLWRRRGSFGAVGVQAGYRALYGVLTVFSLAIFRGYFHDPVAHPTDFDDTLSWLAMIAASGQVGSFLAAAVTPRASRALRPGRWVTGLMAMVAVVVGAIGFVIVPWIFVVGVALLNIASQGTKIVVDTSLQLNVDDEFRGRLFSLNDTMFNLSFILGLFGGAAVLPPDGYAPWLLMLTAGGYVLLTVWFGWMSHRHPPYR